MHCKKVRLFPVGVKNAIKWYLLYWKCFRVGRLQRAVMWSLGSSSSSADPVSSAQKMQQKHVVFFFKQCTRGSVPGTVFMYFSAVMVLVPTADSYDSVWKVYLSLQVAKKQGFSSAWTHSVIALFLIWTKGRRIRICSPLTEHLHRH